MNPSHGRFPFDFPFLTIGNDSCHSGNRVVESNQPGTFQVPMVEVGIKTITGMISTDGLIVINISMMLDLFTPKLPASSSSDSRLLKASGIGMPRYWMEGSIVTIAAVSSPGE